MKAWTYAVGVALICTDALLALSAGGWKPFVAAILAGFGTNLVHFPESRA